MIEYLVLSLPSFIAGGFALAWWQQRNAQRNQHRQNAVLKAVVTEAVNEPDKFRARVGGVGSRLAQRDDRIAAIRQRRKEKRAARNAE